MTTPHSEIVLVGDASASPDPPQARVLFLIQEFTISFRRSLELAVDLGEALTELKASLPHGEWVPWLDAYAPFGERMAQHLMYLWQRRNDISGLPPDTGIGAAIKWLQARNRTPRPTPEHDPATGGHVDVEPIFEPLLRYCLPGTPTDVIISRMLLTFFPGARTALDVTYGSGNFWGETTHIDLMAHDLDPTRAPHGVMSFTELDYDDASFDVVLFDPPHLADGGDDSVMANRFGTVQGQAQLDELVMAGTREAWRVCGQGIIVKITNHVHGQRFQNERDLVAEALGWNQPLYDEVHQVRDHAFIDPSWREQMSAYNNGSTFLVYRKGAQIHGRRTD